MKKKPFLISAAKPLVNSAVEYPELVYLTVLERSVLTSMLAMYEIANMLAAKNESFVEIRNHVPNSQELIVLPGEWLRLQHPELEARFDDKCYDPNTGIVIELAEDEVDEVMRMALDVDINRYACNSHVTWEFSLHGEEPARVHTLTLVELWNGMTMERWW